MTWPLPIDEGPGPRRISQALKATAADMPPAEDPDSTDEEAQAAETTQTGTTNFAISASCNGIGKRNARKESRRTNLAEKPKDEHTG
jgi:hypothetical protein